MPVLYRYWKLLVNLSKLFCYVNTGLATLFCILHVGLGITFQSVVVVTLMLSLGICVTFALFLLYYHHNFQDSSLYFVPENGLLIGHRGGATEAPENTVAAIRTAVLHGSDGVELDVGFTKDNIAVIIHDATVDRTTNGTGLVSSMTYLQLRQLNASAKFPSGEKFSPQVIPKLEDAIEECLHYKQIVFLDCKENAKESANAVSLLFKKDPQLYHKVIVCSFYPTIIYAVKQRDKNIITGLTYRHHLLSRTSAGGPPRFTDTWKNYLAIVLDILIEWCYYSWLWFICGNSLFLMNADMASRSSVRFWNDLGVKVAIWTPNDTAEKKYFRSLNCSIITDKILDD